MFILRRIEQNCGQINTNLGDYYSLILKESEKQQFEETVKEWEKDAIEKMYGVIVFDDDNDCMMPLYKGSKYYVMTSDGRTFDNLTQR